MESSAVNAAAVGPAIAQGGPGKRSSTDVKVVLEPDELPCRWYNILPDLPVPLPPPLNPATKEPITPDMLEPLFPKELIRQEMCSERYVQIPDELREAYFRLGRPTPLFRARRLEKALGTPARIYYKREDTSPTGSHKSNTAVAQAYFNMKEGVERLTTETGAGQWGMALSLASSYFDLECNVFMVRCSYDQKPYRKIAMQCYGGKVIPSPSPLTEFGRALLAQDPNHPGSLGIAISEAMETALKDERTKYSLGSVLNHVLLHQTVIGQETQLQFEKLDIEPDIMVGCVGGGSNFGGFILPQMGRRLARKCETEFLAVESNAVPSICKGRYEYDHGDTARMTPLMKMHTLGCDFIPPPIHAGGLRYHADAPILSLLVDQGLIGAVAYDQDETFTAGRLFASTEGIIPAPETCHAVKAVVDLALEAKRAGQEKVIAFNFSGHGFLDLAGYEKYLE